MPLANSLVGFAVGNDVYLGVKMSDGSRRVVSYDGTYPLGTLLADGDKVFSFACVASPGIREEQPEVVPFRFSKTAANAPAGYETLSAELVFTSYVYDPDKALASWSAKMNVSGVQQIGAISNGDTNIALSGEPIAVEGDVQIFGDSNCLTYPSGEPVTVYARLNYTFVDNDDWSVGQSSDEHFAMGGPDEVDKEYYMRWAIDWAYFNAERFTNGQIVTLVNQEPYNIAGIPTTFTKP